MKRYLVEFIGTFFLFLTIVSVENGSMSGNFFGPIAVGAALIGLIYAGGHISKAHYNPAVTLAIFISGKVNKVDAAMYVLVQVLATILASLVGSELLGKGILFGGGPMPTDNISFFTAEVLGTFILAFVILQVAFTKSNAGTSFYGIAIGSTVTGISYAFGGFGMMGLFNPDVAIGAVFNGLSAVGPMGISIVASLVGGALAALAFRASYPIEQA